MKPLCPPIVFSRRKVAATEPVRTLSLGPSSEAHLQPGSVFQLFSTALSGWEATAKPPGNTAIPLRSAAFTVDIYKTFFGAAPYFSHGALPRQPFAVPKRNLINMPRFSVDDLLPAPSETFRVVGHYGSGAFGQVLRCVSLSTNTAVAIKIGNQPHENSHEAYLLRGLHLRPLAERRHIIEFKQSFFFRGHVCIVLEPLPLNIYQVLKDGHFTGLSFFFVRQALRQILQGLRFLHDEGLIHCDIKPENLLLADAETPVVKIADFGTACYAREPLFTYIQTRFYRAPEILLGLPYTPAIDLWSAGCVAFELFAGRPLFPGTSSQEQLSLISKLLGEPPVAMLVGQRKPRPFFSNTPTETLHRSCPMPLLALVKKHGHGKETSSELETFTDLLGRLLTYDPQQRHTSTEALGHPFFH